MIKTAHILQLFEEDERRKHLKKIGGGKCVLILIANEVIFASQLIRHLRNFRHKTVLLPSQWHVLISLCACSSVYGKLHSKFSSLFSKKSYSGGESLQFVQSSLLFSDMKVFLLRSRVLCNCISRKVFCFFHRLPY